MRDRSSLFQRLVPAALATSLFAALAHAALVAVGLEMYLFESSLNSVSWQYGLISVPASWVAWYGSVYHVSRHV